MQYNNKFDSILERMSKIFPSIHAKVVSWYPSDKSEIVVILDDGVKMAYESFDDTIRTIKSEYISSEVMDEVSYRKKFSDALRYQMRMSGIIQYELSEQTGISVQTLSKYLRGTATPSAYNIFKIANALGCPISKLISYDI